MTRPATPEELAAFARGDHDSAVHVIGGGQLVVGAKQVRPEVARRNLNNRKRGNRTSHDLAVYLGGRNVEALKAPWDVEACGCRIQSKRLAVRPSLSAIVNLIEYIPSTAAGEMRCLFYVGAGQRLASGRIWAGLREWVEWRGWDMPSGAQLHIAREGGLIEMPVATYRDAARGETR